MESFVKMFYIFNMEKHKRFATETDDMDRVKSSLEYWRDFEKNVGKFWKDALEITRECGLSNEEKLDKLHDHIFDNFQMFKID